MAKIVRCACGLELRSDDEDDLIRLVQEHARERHDLTLSVDEVRDMVEDE
jgi:predicted small metal-binding protein